MNSSTNLISIITPTFNSTLKIEKNVNSILCQSYDKFEHLIIDNKSEDTTLSIIRELYSQTQYEQKLRIISEKDNGISDAFNKGINLANGNIITILNSDDYYTDKELFKDVIKAFEDPNCLFVHGDIFEYDLIYGSIIRFPKGSSMKKGMIYNHPTMFFRKDVYDNFGLFNTSYKFAMDYEFLVRLESKMLNFHLSGVYLKGTPKVFMSYGGNSWKNMLGGKREEAKALKEYSMWTFSARKNYFKNVLKIRVKQFLVRIGLSSFVILVRQMKWKVSHPNCNNRL